MQVYIFMGSTDLETGPEGRYLSLCRAAQEGDWQKAKEFISSGGSSGSVIAQVMVSSDKVLHIAASEGHSKFNDACETALHIAVFVGNTESIKAMVERNQNLTQIADGDDKIPIVNAANFAPRKAKRDIVEYLYSVMSKNQACSSLFSGGSGCRIICSVIGAGFYVNVGREMINKYPDLALERQGGHCALEMIARSPNAFLSESHLLFWDHFIYSLASIDIGNNISKNEEAAVRLVNCIFERMKLTKTSLEIEKYFTECFAGTNVLDIAITTGTTGFLMECFRSFPGLVWIPLGDQGLSIFSIAIMRRQENIFNLMAATKDKHGNTILHLAALCHLPRQTKQGSIDLKIKRNLGSC
ncbi:hypothetical protein MKX01_035829, partial [Papaver californicum]